MVAMLVPQPTIDAKRVSAFREVVTKAIKGLPDLELLTNRRVERMLFPKSSLTNELDDARQAMRQGARYQLELDLPNAKKALLRAERLYWMVMPLKATTKDLVKVYATLAMVYLPQDRNVDVKLEFRNLLRLHPHLVLDKAQYPPKVRKLFAFEKTRSILIPSGSALLKSRRVLDYTVSLAVDRLLVAQIVRSDRGFRVRLEAYDGRTGIRKAHRTILLKGGDKKVLKTLAKSVKSFLESY